jgi:hypothetical protein
MMIEYKRRMPRVEKIPEISETKVNIQRLNNDTFNQDIITVNRLRYAKLHFVDFDEIALSAMKQKMPADIRTKEIIENIGKVESTENYNDLFDFLYSKIGCDAITSLMKKLRNKNPDLCRDVLSKLTTGYNDIFMDNAILILGKEYCYKDISNDIISALKTNKIRDPLDFSSLTMILGKSNDARHLNFLYTFYVFFKDNFPEEEYYEGPLLAINELTDNLEHQKT